MQDITGLSKSDKSEIAEYIKRDNLQIVNERIQQVHVKKSFYTRYVKRLLDIIVSLIAIVVSLPINVVIALVTFFDVGTPIIFKQKRIGKGQKSFTIYKFRNMTNATDVNGELLPPSERVTKWGRFVRKTSLDELLNFVSVLKGDMSIIGPRPLLDSYVDRLNERHKMIYSVRPGLECPILRKTNCPISWQERLENYVWYVENCGFVVDVKLSFRIIQIAFDRKSTEQRAEAGHGGFLGYGLDGNVIYTKTVPDCFVEEFCLNHGFHDLEEAIESRKATSSEEDAVQKEAV